MTQGSADTKIIIWALWIHLTFETRAYSWAVSKSPVKFFTKRPWGIIMSSYFDFAGRLDALLANFSAGMWFDGSFSSVFTTSPIIINDCDQHMMTPIVMTDNYVCLFDHHHSWIPSIRKGQRLEMNATRINWPMRTTSNNGDPLLTTCCASFNSSVSSFRQNEFQIAVIPGQGDLARP